MKILITGGTGLVGTKLVKELRKRGHTVNVLVRKKSNKPNEFYWNYSRRQLDSEALEGVESIIHLAGASIGKKWTYEYKQELISSRVDSANFLYDHCTLADIKLKSFISASGVNYYGTFISDDILNEEAGIVKHDFLSDLCLKWESAALHFGNIADRTVILRTAPVLSEKGGTMEKLNMITNLNLSSAIGKGSQWFNWIHLDDLVDMYVQAVENPKFEGVFNAVADEIPTNKEFMKSLAKSRSKLFLPVNVPSFLLRMVFGEMSVIILEGTRVRNKKIKSLGFDFKYPELKQALKSFVKA